MSGSISLNTSQAAAYTQAYNPVNQVNKTPKPEANETKTAEKNESASTQLREPEKPQAGAALLKALNTNEAQNLPSAATQQAANTQTNRLNGMKAYNQVGNSQFNFA
jgi:hypothetical protein